MKFIPRKIQKTADNSSGKESRIEKLKNFGCVVGGLAVLYFAIGFVADFAAMRVSEETEAKYFGATYFSMQSESAPPEFDRVRKTFDRLTQDKRLRPLPYKLVYWNEETPNAFAVPGGWVIVTQGLLDSVTNETAMAFILGHELGHHQYRHTLRGIGRRLLIALTFGFMFGSVDGGVVSGAVDLAELEHSRHDERQADDFGFRLAYSGFGDADGYLDFFVDLRDQHEKGDSRWLKFVNSHPPTSERLDYLKDLQEKLASRKSENGNQPTGKASPGGATVPSSLP